MTPVGWAMIGLAAGYVALALYGKYRQLKEEFREAREEEAERARARMDEDPGALG